MIYSVTQVNNFIKGLIEQDTFLENLQISGEVSNVNYHPSGIIYFTMKDEKSSMRGIMYRSNVLPMKFRMKDGDKVVITGTIQVYTKGGYHQIVAKKIEQQGSGVLYQRYLELKEELKEMGMFDATYKREIPKYIKSLGIVTSPSGAAVRDIIRIAKRRNPHIKIVLCPALVQGESGAGSIVHGIETLDKMGLDVMIVGRGGGSIEDLWSFNEKIVAQAIFDCDTPIISAVGHETDYTIADFVADMRAATPSEAAEKAVTRYEEVEDRYAEDLDELLQWMQYVMEKKKNKLEVLSHRLAANSPEQRLLSYKNRLENCSTLLQLNMKNSIRATRSMVPDSKLLSDILLFRVEAMKKRLIGDSGRLDSVSPLKKLDSGYSYPIDKTGKHLKGVDAVTVGDSFDMIMHDGVIHAVAKNIEKNDIRGKYIKL